MSDFVGKIGERVGLNVVLKGYISRPSWKNKRSQDQERQKIILFEDEHGNIITIRSGGKFKPGGKWRVMGKVKRHHCFNGQKQTYISEWSLMLQGKKKDG